MKSVKAAAVVTGALAIAGAATPAFAQHATDAAGQNLNNTVVKTLREGPVHVAPLEQSDLLDVKAKEKSLGDAVDRSSTALGSGTSLVGGLPLQG
jgi:hypothetical protein